MKVDSDADAGAVGDSRRRPRSRNLEWWMSVSEAAVWALGDEGGIRVIGHPRRRRFTDGFEVVLEDLPGDGEPFSAGRGPEAVITYLHEVPG